MCIKKQYKNLSCTHLAHYILHWHTYSNQIERKLRTSTRVLENTHVPYIIYVSYKNFAKAETLHGSQVRSDRMHTDTGVSQLPYGFENMTNHSYV